MARVRINWREKNKLNNQKERIEVRKLILSCMDEAPRTTAQIKNLIKKGGVEVSSVKIGNNLKFLEDLGYVSRQGDTVSNRTWLRVNFEEYSEVEVIFILVPVSAKVNKELDKLSKLLDIPKGQLAREAIEEQIGLK